MNNLSITFFLFNIFDLWFLTTHIEQSISIFVARDNKDSDWYWNVRWASEEKKDMNRHEEIWRGDRGYRTNNVRSSDRRQRIQLERIRPVEKRQLEEWMELPTWEKKRLLFYIYAWGGICPFETNQFEMKKEIKRKWRKESNNETSENEVNPSL